MNTRITFTYMLVIIGFIFFSFNFDISNDIAIYILGISLGLSFSDKTFDMRSKNENH